MSTQSARSPEPTPRETEPSDAEPETPPRTAQVGSLLGFLIVGIFFGIVLTKSEVISWFRIQEMFRFQAFHMYGIIGSAVVVAALSLLGLRALDATAWSGRPIELSPKILGNGTRYWLGGTLFGLGWALTGACPGPLFALVGNGIGVYLVAIAAALVGTWTYGALRPHLPHY